MLCIKNIIEENIQKEINEKSNNINRIEVDIQNIEGKEHIQEIETTEKNLEQKKKIEKIKNDIQKIQLVKNFYKKVKSS